MTKNRMHKNKTRLRTRRRLLLEKLENREVFAGDVTPVYLSNDGVLHIVGTDSADSVVVSGSQGHIDVAWLNQRTNHFDNVKQVEFWGGNGNDSYTSLANDLRSFVHGGAGDDVIFGTNDYDGLYGDDGSDTLNGSTDFDSIYWNNGVLYVTGTDGNDVIEFVRNDGRAYLFGHGKQLNRTLPMPSRVEVDGAGGNDTITNVNLLVPVNIHGGAGNDVLSGRANTDGVDSYDAVFGDSGSDTLNGSTDFDSIYWNNGVLYVTGSEGNDVIEFVRNDGRAYLFGHGKQLNRTWPLPSRIETNGAAGNDTITNVNLLVPVNIHGGAGNDVLSGRANTDGVDSYDAVFGDSGSDTLNGSTDFDSIYWNNGVLYVTGSEGNDVIEFVRNDGRAYLFGHGKQLNRTWPLPSRVEIDGAAGNDTITNVNLLVPVNIHGGTGDDVLSGRANTDGVDSYDAVFGDSGSDTLNGSTGFDSIYWNNGVLYVTGTDGNDVIEFVRNDGRAYLFGHGKQLNRTWPMPSRVEINGAAGNDTITNVNLLVPVNIHGGAGNDVLSGRANTDGVDSYDAVFGDSGSDTLNGSTDFDSIYWNNGVLYVTGSEGNDVIEFVRNNGRAYLFGHGKQLNRTWPMPSRVDVDGAAGNDTITVLNLTVPVTILGGSGNDAISCLGMTMPVALYGGSGDDALTGGNGSDILSGDEGSDRLEGGRGNDRYKFVDAVFAEVDTIIEQGGQGEFGIDSLDFTKLSSAINVDLRKTGQFASMNNRVVSGAGTFFETVYGGSGGDILIGSLGTETLDGGPGDDVLYGAGGADALIGGAGADRGLMRDGAKLVDQGQDDAGILFANNDVNWSDAEILQVDIGFAKIQSYTHNTNLLKLTNQPVRGSLLIGIPPRGSFGTLPSLVFERVRFIASDRPGFLVYADNNNIGTIRFADAAFNASPSYSPVWTIVIHELGHNWDEAFENTSFSIFYANAEPKFVSEYAKTDRQEDFAETLVAAFVEKEQRQDPNFQNYRYKPLDAPAKVQYMKDWLRSMSTTSIRT